MKIEARILDGIKDCLKLTVLEKLHANVASPDKFAVNIKLGDSRPV